MRGVERILHQTSSLPNYFPSLEASLPALQAFSSPTSEPVFLSSSGQNSIFCVQWCLSLFGQLGQMAIASVACEHRRWLISRSSGGWKRKILASSVSGEGSLSQMVSSLHGFGCIRNCGLSLWPLYKDTNYSHQGLTFKT